MGVLGRSVRRARVRQGVSREELAADADALLGERALLEGGKRTATIWATTPIRVAVVPPDAIDESALPELAASHRRED